VRYTASHFYVGGYNIDEAAGVRLPVSEYSGAISFFFLPFSDGIGSFDACHPLSLNLPHGTQQKPVSPVLLNLSLAAAVYVE